jgi:flavin-dependent dehydrogenase
MLEVICIVLISQKIAAMMKAKGRSSVGYVLLFIALWIGGEITGGIFGVILMFAFNIGQDMEFPILALVGALAGAAVGGGIGYAIAAAMPAVDQPYRQDDDDDEDGVEDERPGRRRSGEYRGSRLDYEKRTPHRRGKDDGTFEEHDDR